MLKIEQLYGKKVDILEDKIEDYKMKLTEGTETITDLSRFKKSYDQIHKSNK